MPKLADLYGVDLNRLGKYRPEYTSVMERPLITQVKGKFNKTSLSDDVEAMVQDFAEKRGATIASR